MTVQNLKQLYKWDEAISFHTSFIASINQNIIIAYHNDNESDHRSLHAFPKCPMRTDA